ncbi:hypothetical protein OQA88_1258 [Cercophora sp. LCS_1]
MLTVLKLTAIPTTFSALYLLYIHHKIAQRTTAETKLFNGTKSIPPSIQKPHSMPPDITNDPDTMIAYERVSSHPIHIQHTHLTHAPLDTILTRYIRATMLSFSRTPQVFLLKRMIPNNKLTARTFGEGWIQKCGFDVGDTVNGFWRVAHRGVEGDDDIENERIELVMEAPDGYRGPVVQGIVVVGAQRVADGKIVFVNETWMWRGQNEKKGLLESVIGRWLHVLLSGWLVGRGVDALASGVGK